jgi:hypothetical protein
LPCGGCDDGEQDREIELLRTAASQELQLRQHQAERGAAGPLVLLWQRVRLR